MPAGKRVNGVRQPPKRAPMVVELLAAVAITVGAVLLVQRLLVKPYEIPTDSMAPSLQVGQRILVDRLVTKPRLYAVVVFHPPSGALRGEYGLCGRKSQGYARDAACDQDEGTESSATYVKRVVGLPGDHLTIIRGQVVRNGVPEHASYIQPCYLGPRVCDFPIPITVPRGQYFVMGDNRGASDDSRFWGPVPRRWIIGVAIATYWPIDRIGFF